jgi:molecular chaperone GrpE
MSTSNKDSEAVNSEVEASEIEGGGDEGEMTVVSAEPEDMDDVEETVVGSMAEDPVGDEESLDIEVEGAGGELQARIEELEQAKQETYERLLRATADLDNTRKRARRDVKDARVDERSKVLREILPVIDNLERAASHAAKGSDESEAVKSIVDGVNLVLRQFLQTMERMDVKLLEAVGKPFDPAVHEAVSQAPSADHPPGTVIEVLQSGYMVGDRLLRPALSVVSIAMVTEESSDSSDEES